MQLLEDDDYNYVYDTVNRMAVSTDSLGNERRYQYDCNHNAVVEESLEKSGLGLADRPWVLAASRCDDAG